MKDERLYHSIATKITKMIDDGEYPTGSRLPGERELAEQFGVSRVTIREAEIALQALGRLKIKTGSGVYVLEPTNGAMNGILPNASAFELTQARLIFESEAAALAATTISDEALEHLENLIEKMSTGTSEESEQADMEFHLTIAAASDNTVVSHVINMLWKIRNESEAIKEVHNSVCSTDLKLRGNEHEEILDALRDRDAAAARAAMRHHFGRLLETMLDATEALALDEIRKKSSASREKFLRSV
ncbi:MAG: FadR/GntR family transcriptional regulator [Gammaproteobacteria bacterium]